MAFEDVQILCQGFDWGAVAEEPEDANFFNPALPTAITPVVDLKYWLTEESPEEINYRFETTGKDNTGKNALFGSYAEMSLEISDAGPAVTSTGLTMQQFFSFFGDTTYIKYAVMVFYKGSIIFLGILQQENLSEDFPETDGATDTGSNIIQAQVLSYDKEFYDYYNAKELLSHHEMPWTGQTPGVAINYISLLEFVKQLFPGVAVELEPSLESFKVIESPQFYVHNGKLHWFKVGYERIVTENQDKRFMAFTKACNAMGWAFYFRLKNGTMTLTIQNRVSFDAQLPRRTLDFRNIMSYTLKKRAAISKYDYVVIIDGSLDGGQFAFGNDTRLRGARVIVISNKMSPSFNEPHFSSVQQGNPVHSAGYTLEYSEGYRFCSYYNDDESFFRFVEWEVTSTSPFRVVSRGKEIPKAKTLFVNTGTNSREKAFVALDTGINRGYTEGSGAHVGNWDLIYSGNYGNMFFKMDGGQVSLTYSNSDTSKSYIHSDIFYRNQKLLLRSNGDQLMDVKMAEFFSDPYTILKYNNAGITPFMGTEWVLNSFTMNPFQDTVSFESLMNDE